MEAMPWFGWIIIAGIIVYGVITVTELLTGRSKESLECRRVAELEEKVRKLESTPRSDTP